MSLAAARAAARRRMLDTVRIERADGEAVTDAYGQVTQPVITVHEGPARVHYPTAQPRGITPGELQAVALRPVVSIPHDVADVRPDDDVVVLTCPADPALVGRRYRVVAVPGGQVTARRLECEEVQA